MKAFAGRLFGFEMGRTRSWGGRSFGFVYVCACVARGVNPKLSGSPARVMVNVLLKAPTDHTRTLCICV